ncbi:MAG: fused MFS/spermidine synthase [Verrucomicrobiota bacterium]
MADGAQKKTQNASGGMVFGVAVFLGAFLLFFVEPVAGRRLLPRVGGGPGVWLTCVMYVQGVLLAGYLYAHWAVRRLSVRGQVGLHVGLMAVAIVLVLLVGRSGGEFALVEMESGWGGPQGAIIWEMLKMIGLPFVLLGASSPLLQSWYHRCYPGREAYRLYALSNVGSLGALVGYVVLVEPRMSLGAQEWFWIVGLVVFLGAAWGCGWMAMRAREEVTAEGAKEAAAVEGDGADDEREGEGKSPARRSRRQLKRERQAVLAKERAALEEAALAKRVGGVGWGPILSWVVLAAWPSVMLMGVTYALTVDVAPVPFLWLLPLGLYLVTLIICFDHERWYHRGVWLPLAVVALSAMGWWLWEQQESGYALGSGFFVPMAILCGGLFVAGMACHGELTRRKPAAEHLTVFYLSVSAGGFLGGVFVSLLAPVLFHSILEMPIGVWGTAATLWILVALPFLRKGRGGVKKAKKGGGDGVWKKWVAWGSALWVLGLGYGLVKVETAYTSGHLDEARSFFGMLAVGESEKGDEGWFRWLVHGTIDHGGQFQDAGYRHKAVTYYGPASGAAVAIGRHPKRLPAFAEAKRPIRVGVCGLGVGGIAAWMEPGEFIRFYEIDPQVEVYAREYFSYLEDCPAEVEVVLGDARMSLAWEAAAGEEKFDVLVMDAFTGDAIPVHLLTREAVALYWERLEEDGILAFNITKEYVDIFPVLEGLAAEFGKQLVVVNNSAVDSWRIYQANWALMTSNQAFLHAQAGVDFDPEVEIIAPEGSIVWTDDYSSVWSVLRVFRNEDEEEGGEGEGGEEANGG